MSIFKEIRETINEFFPSDQGWNLFYRFNQSNQSRFFVFQRFLGSNTERSIVAVVSSDNVQKKHLDQLQNLALLLSGKQIKICRKIILAAEKAVINLETEDVEYFPISRRSLGKKSSDVNWMEKLFPMSK